jgi:excisionase family DNA binding protein
LHWQGGDHTQVEFPKIHTGQHCYATDHELVEMIGKLARIEPDARIASILNKNEHRTAHGKSWTARIVCAMRNRHAIPVYRQGERQDRDEISVREAADALGVTPTTIFRLIQLKQLPAEQICGNAPWILLKNDVERYREARNRATHPSTSNSTKLLFEIQ